MNKSKNLKNLLVASTIACPFLCSFAHAQSSVTLYGVLDSGLNYTSNAGGHSAYAIVSGDVSETRFGLKGTEDLGAGLSTIFTLENGTNLSNGQLNEGGRLFGRQAFVGLNSVNYGTFTMGRQYDATIDVWSPFTGAGNAIGDFAAHPFDNDNADYDFRFNNSVKYVSPTFHGLQLEAAYGFSNAANFAANRAYSAGVSYTEGSFSAALAYLRQSDGNSTTTGAVGGDGVFTASRQQNIDAGVKWTFGDGSNVAFAYSHVSANHPTVNAYVPNIGSQAWTSWKFGNFEINGQYYITPSLYVAGAYTYTRASLDSADAPSRQNWNQASLMLNYALSKRTSVYVQGAYQHTNGETGTGLDPAFIFGSAGTSSSGSQMVYRVALLHTF